MADWNELHWRFYERQEAWPRHADLFRRQTCYGSLAGGQAQKSTKGEMMQIVVQNHKGIAALCFENRTYCDTWNYASLSSPLVLSAATQRHSRIYVCWVMTVSCLSFHLLDTSSYPNGVFVLSAHTCNYNLHF